VLGGGGKENLEEETRVHTIKGGSGGVREEAMGER